MPIPRFARSLTLSCLTIVALTSAQAQTPAPAQTATQFYMAYRAAFDKAAKIEDLLPFMSAASKKEVEATPAADRAKMFGLMKIMGTLTSVKVLKEERAGDGATLTAEGLDTDKKKTTGKITIIKEGGAWKLGAESWS